MELKIFFHPERCMLCLSCVLACQLKSLGIREVTKVSHGQRPLPRISVRFDHGTPWVAKCRHCITPPCVEACVTGSLVQRNGRAGVVHHAETCVACGSCLLACPYGSLTYDDREERMVKCDLCSGEEVPSCVRACQTKALVYREPNLFAWNKKKRFAREWRRLHDGD
jgi:carbon-monoxide dehydrogenase iron sulfur subunit